MSFSETGLEYGKATLQEVVEAMPCGSIMIMNSNGGEIQFNYNPYPYTGVGADAHGITTITKYFELQREKVEFNNGGTRILHLTAYGTPNTWLPAAAASKPVVQSLPLGAAFSAVRAGACSYWKDQFNVVHVILAANKNSGVLTGWGELYATLPAGYRPGQRLEFPVTFGQPWSSGSLYVETDGTIVASASSLSDAGLYTVMACFSFVAVS